MTVLTALFGEKVCVCVCVYEKEKTEFEKRLERGKVMVDGWVSRSQAL